MGKPKQKDPTDAYYPVKIVETTFSDVTRERNYDDEWDCDDLVHSTTIHGVHTAELKTGSMYELVVPFKIEEDGDYYLVFVTYSTGDSFHHEEGRVRYIDLFKTKEKAEACAKAIDEHYSHASMNNVYNRKHKPPKGYNESSISYFNEEGREMTTYVSWTGYFERMSCVTVERVEYKLDCDRGRIRYRY